tara:strand:+ start:321 stop:611 length:291 start_codon:yes stop_codon:yes gene_type:complete
MTANTQDAERFVEDILLKVYFPEVDFEKHNAKTMAKYNKYIQEAKQALLTWYWQGRLEEVDGFNKIRVDMPGGAQMFAKRVFDRISEIKSKLESEE